MITGADLLPFLLTVTFSFLVGLETKTYNKTYHADETRMVGTVRTYTFLGIIGYLFYTIDDSTAVYVAGFVGMTLMYAIFYYYRVANGKHSIMGYLVASIVYTFGPLTLLFPFWLAALVFVLVVFTLNAKNSIEKIISSISGAELETLSKMVLLSAVILPILPNENVIPYLPLSPFKIWLAVVVISAISYGGYITQRYIFPGKGFFLTGLIGGIYSSTATTVVLAKKSNMIGGGPIASASILVATSMMYIRLLIVTMVFNIDIAKDLAPPLVIFFAASFIVSLFYYRGERVENAVTESSSANPLELGTAFVFSAIFVFMIVLTQFVVSHYGVDGLKLLSFIVGFTDIDPFILSLLTGSYNVDNENIYHAVMIAAGSNNILKAVYAFWFGGRLKILQAALWLLLFGLLSIGVGLLPVWHLF